MPVRSCVLLHMCEISNVLPALMHRLHKVVTHSAWQELPGQARWMGTVDVS